MLRSECIWLISLIIINLFHIMPTVSGILPINIPRLVPTNFSGPLRQTVAPDVHEDAKLSVPQLIRKSGFPCQTHEVITSDGYILSLHRIPNGKRSSGAGNSIGRGHGIGKTQKPVVFLQHGLLGDSSNFIINSEDKSLGFILANQNWDVWIGNARGNTYSKRHLKLKPTQPEFWKFGWNEMGVYDIPAVLDYILAFTGEEKLIYIGHSMGSTMFFVAMAAHPEYNSKIKLMIALAPLAYTYHMKSPIKLLAPVADQIEDMLHFFGSYEFLPNSKYNQDSLGAQLCRKNTVLKEVCSNALFLIIGYDSNQLNQTLMSTVQGHGPAGTSTRTVVHYAQNAHSGHFRNYNHGKLKNREIYGQDNPPSYDLTKVTCPVAFFWGQNDWLATPENTMRLATQIPNLVLNLRINYTKFNHLDFLIAKNVNEVLNNPLMRLMKNY